MDKKVIDKISNTIHGRFPETSGVKPNVKKQSIPKSGKSSSPDIENYLLTYKTKGKGPAGQTIPRWVRVVADSRGKIIKITTSK